MFIIFAYFCFLFFIYKRLLFVSLFFQQKEYSLVQFLKFIFYKFQLIDKRLSIVLFLYTIPAVRMRNLNIDMFVLSNLFVLFAFLTPNVLKGVVKKKLDLTNKLVIILLGTFVLCFSFSLSLFEYIYILNLNNVYCFCNYVGFLIFVVQIIPFLLLLSSIFFLPLEIFIKYICVRKAKKKLLKINPVVIGITGSFGKTSTKNILNHILSSTSFSVTTPGSINTLLGVSKFILTNLKQEHKFFIVEMGTDGNGQIRKLCKLLNPKYAILTAVGNAHLSKFKTQDNIAKEKFSLINWVKLSSGNYIVNTKMVDNKYIKKYSVGVDNFDIKDYKITLDGISFTLSYNDNSYKIFAPIFGKHQLQNISLAFIMALKLKVPVASIISSLMSLPQIEHRLEVKNDGNITIIDDAYNSNINGFKSALCTLKDIANIKQGRSILVTPGMVELGNCHDVQHVEIAKLSVKTVDIAIIVLPYRVESFVNTFEKNKNSEQKLILVNNLKEAREFLSKNILPYDTILYENDLPDIFEMKINI